MKTPSNRSRPLRIAVTRGSWAVFLVLAGCGGQGAGPAGEGEKEARPAAPVSGAAVAPEASVGKAGSAESAVPAGVILPDPDEEKGKADGPRLPK